MLGLDDVRDDEEKEMKSWGNIGDVLALGTTDNMGSSRT